MDVRKCLPAFVEEAEADEDEGDQDDDRTDNALELVRNSCSPCHVISIHFTRFMQAKALGVPTKRAKKGLSMMSW